MSDRLSAFAAVLTLALLIPFSKVTFAADTESGVETQSGGIEEIVVTAQKREQNINDVGMSIQAATGEQLNRMGVVDTAQLDKVVTGFTSDVTYYGTTIYTIRGVGFQDTSLAGSPTVSVYVDEMPLQFSAMTPVATLDLQRVEVLKGPQGTLFGENSTGGAVNYIANKPTQDFEAGIDGSYGRFNRSDFTGFVSGPLSDTLSYRIAGRALNSDGWQSTYVSPQSLPPDPYWTTAGATYHFDNQWGQQKFYNTRAQLLWEPSDRLSARLTYSYFKDKGDSQMPQLFGIAPLHPAPAVLDPLVADYPPAPHNARDASWGPCVNTNGGTPANWVGMGGINLSNRLYNNCSPARKNNDFYSPSLRVDYHINDDLTLTSLSSYSKFTRNQQLESDGTIYQDYESYQNGYLKAWFQELRVAGSVMGEGNWVLGANYEWTKTWDSFLQTYGISTAVPTLGLPLGPTNPNNAQKAKTWAMFGNIEYPMWDTVTLQAGLRYTNQRRDYRGCGSDGGDGSWSAISQIIQTFLQGPGGPGGIDVGPGACASTGPPPTYYPVASGFTDQLNQDNWSWRIGANWQVQPDWMLYANVSDGYKSGSFPTVASAAFTQLFPAKQEELLAYEIGGKFTMFDDRLQLNVAGFYYNYKDKQILGAINDPVFGSLPALVNVPDSHVIGYEFDAVWEPIEGLRIAPSLSYANSEVDGHFRNYDPFFAPGTPADPQNGSTKNFTGEPFPNAPKWTSNLDVQYSFGIGRGMTAFIGAHLNYQSDTTGFFYDRCNETGKIDPVSGLPVTCTKTYMASIPTAYGNTDLKIKARTLIDARAGIEAGPWSVWAWGQNITDEYYWVQAQHVNDVLLRYAGMPATYGVTASYRFGE